MREAISGRVQNWPWRENMKVDEYEVPEDLYYTREHEWARVLEDGTVVMGITDYAQKQLHEIVNVTLPELGARVKQMEPFASVDSVKATSDIYAPVSGEVIEMNEELLDRPELLNEDPYGRGWIAKLRPPSREQLESELANLMDAKRYADYIKEEGSGSG